MTSGRGCVTDVSRGDHRVAGIQFFIPQKGVPVKLSNIRSALVVAALGALGSAVSAQEITGAGATFPAPIYAKWADAYNKATGVRVNYQSVGSGAGIQQIRAKTVDFGASDMPLKDEDMAKDGLMQFPTVIGGVVPVVNIKGISPGQIKLTGAALGDIYLGKITKWNDPALTALNPGVPLPDAAISVVRRADGSGTTFIFTNYLSKVSSDWKEKIGEGSAVQWPVGLGGKGNEGVSAFVQRLPGSIGYVEYSYAKQNKLAHTLLKNKEGSVVGPTEGAFAAAAASADGAAGGTRRGCNAPRRARTAASRACRRRARLRSAATV